MHMENHYVEITPICHFNSFENCGHQSKDSGLVCMHVCLCKYAYEHVYVSVCRSVCAWVRSLCVYKTGNQSQDLTPAR